MIDLHSHVLPAVDDGASDDEEAVAMATLAAGAGTRRLVATPHVRHDYPQVVPEEVGARVAALNALLRQRGISLDVLPGGEVDLVEALERPVEQLRAVTLGGNGLDLLVETPFGPLPSTFDHLLESVVARGFRVVLAHPEVNSEFKRDPQRLGRLAARGILVQVTASAFESRRSERRRVVLEAVRCGWAHCIASDGHSVDWRPPRLDAGLAAARAALPGAEERLEWLVTDAPKAILAGEPLPSPPPYQPPARRSRFRLLRR